MRLNVKLDEFDPSSSETRVKYTCLIKSSVRCRNSNHEIVKFNAIWPVESFWKTFDLPKAHSTSKSPSSLPVITPTTNHLPHSFPVLLLTTPYYLPPRFPFSSKHPLSNTIALNEIRADFTNAKPWEKTVSIKPSPTHKFKQSHPICLNRLESQACPIKCMSPLLVWSL